MPKPPDLTPAAASLALYPAGVPSICTYSILPDSLDALAAALVGAIVPTGRLPVAVPGFGA